jgi:hypothetical protein
MPRAGLVGSAIVPLRVHGEGSRVLA